MSIDVAQYARITQYKIPKSASGKPLVCYIMGDIYTHRRKGWFVFQYHASNNACGLNHNGTWDKYGEPFQSPQEAFDTLRNTEFLDQYDRYEEQDVRNKGDNLTSETEGV